MDVEVAERTRLGLLAAIKTTEKGIRQLEQAIADHAETYKLLGEK